MTDRAVVSRWLAGYEAAWRAPGTGALPEIFAADALADQLSRPGQDGDRGAGGVLLHLPPGSARHLAECGKDRRRGRQRGSVNGAGRPPALLDGGQHRLAVQHTLGRMHPGV